MIKDISTNRKRRSFIMIQKLLALMAAGDKRAMRLARNYAKELVKSPADPTSPGMVTWEWGYKGIFLGEYYAMTKDKSVLPAIKALNVAYEEGQYPHNGGYTHRPYPAIQKRIFEGGPKGYGAMASPGGLCMLAQSIFKASGIPYSEIAYESTHQAFLRSANSDGKIFYGFSNGYECMFIHVAAKSPCRGKKGVGFLCPTGMKGIGPYNVEKWTNEEGRHIWKMELVSPAKYEKFFSSNQADLRVYDLGDNRRFVVKPITNKEPTGPYKTGKKGDFNIAAEGLGALAHIVGNPDNKSWNYLGKHLATCCANSAKYLWDGHGDASIHAFFGVLGAAKADERDVRAFLDYSKTWIILSETHDGHGLIEQPFGIQGNGWCGMTTSDRSVYSRIALLLLSIPKQRLLITGAGSAAPAATTIKTTRPSTITRRAVVPVRKARTVSPERLASLDRSLIRVLAKLSLEKSLKPVQLRMSKTRAKVWLADAAADGTLTYQMMDSEKQAEFNIKDLPMGDHVTLSLLVAKLRPDSKDAQAMVAVYMESMGRVEDADRYFDKAGEESKKKLEKLFD